MKMGFNKKYIPTIDILQQMVYDYGVGYVINQFEKADALIGSEESVRFLEKLKEEEHEMGAK
jgi:hypothetical protein